MTYSRLTVHELAHLGEVGFGIHAHHRDLFIIGDIGLRALSRLLKEPSLKIGREINPHIMTEKEFTTRKNKQEHFVTRVLESPKLMIIGNKDEFDRLG